MPLITNPFTKEERRAWKKAVKNMVSEEKEGWQKSLRQGLKDLPPAGNSRGIKSVTYNYK